MSNLKNNLHPGFEIPTSLAEAFLVPEGKEKEFYDKHELVVKHLENGITILGAARGARDTRNIDIDIIFPFGARNDPSGKAGLSHFFEHMLPSGIHNISRKLRLRINASTGADAMTFKADGHIIFVDEQSKIGQPIGVLPFVPVIFNMLVDPLKMHEDNLQKRFEGERSSIRGEIIQDENSPARRNFRAMCRIIWASDNPRQMRPAGTDENVSTITIEDFQTHRDSFLIPEGMVIRVFTGGTREMLNTVINEFIENFRKFPRTNIKRQFLDYSKWYLCNEEFIAGKNYALDTGFPVNQLNLAVGWKLDVPFHSHDYLALRVLEVLLSRKIHDVVRESADIDSYSPRAELVMTQDITLLVLDMRFGTETMLSKGLITVEKLREYFLTKILPEVFDRLKDSDIDEYLLSRRAEQAAGIPILKQTLLDDVLAGLRRYDRPFNRELIADAENKLTMEDVRNVQKLLKPEEAITTIIGDLSKLTSKAVDQSYI